MDRFFQSGSPCLTDELAQFIRKHLFETQFVAWPFTSRVYTLFFHEKVAGM